MTNRKYTLIGLNATRRRWPRRSAFFVQLWFAHTPRLGDEDKKGSEKEAWIRASKFVDYVSRQLAGGDRFVNDLVEEVVADDEELTAQLDEV